MQNSLCRRATLKTCVGDLCCINIWEFPKLTWLFQTWLFAIFTRKRSFALFCALLRTCVCALLCSYLRSFARICVFLRTAAFRTTAFGNSRRIGGDFAGDFPRIFLGTFSHENENKNPTTQSAKKSGGGGGPKIKIPEKCHNPGPFSGTLSQY